MVEAGLGGHLFHKLLGESGQREEGLPQSILGDLTQEEGLVFGLVGCRVQPHG